MKVNSDSKKVENLVRSHIFLIDGIGALASALTIGFILPYLNEGLSSKILILFASVASVFSLYSISCHFLKRSRRWLVPIICGNILFCVSTLAVTVYFLESMNSLLILYFAGEAILIGTLVTVEIKILNGQEDTERNRIRFSK